MRSIERLGCRITSAVLCLLSGGVYAGALGLAPYVEAGLGYESNVFRVEDQAEAQAILGTSQRNDTKRYGALGLAAELPYSRQRLTLAGEVSEVRYDRFEQLDHSENQLRGALEFEIGNFFNGTASYQRTRILGDFGNLDVAEPNFVTESEPRLEIFFEATPNWRLRNVLSRRQRDNSLSSQRSFNIEENLASLEVQRLGRPGSLLGIGAEVIDGSFPQREPGGLFANDFIQTTGFASAKWRYSGVSDFNGRLGYTNRDNSGGGSRDFSGVTGRFGYNYAASGKSRLYFALSRQIYSVENVDANFIRETAATGRWTWNYSPKLEANLELRHAQQDFESPAGTTTQDRSDTLDVATAGLTYSPFRVMALILNLGGERRDSNETGQSYEAFIAGLALRLTFDND